MDDRMRYITALNGTLGTALTVALNNVSAVLSVAAGVLTVIYMWNQVRISHKKLHSDQK